MSSRPAYLLTTCTCHSYLLPPTTCYLVATHYLLPTTLLSTLSTLLTAAELVWAEPDYPALDALALMLEENIRHLPIVRPHGVVATTAEPPTMIAVLSMREEIC